MHPLFPMCLITIRRTTFPRTTLPVGCYPNGMFSNSTINFYELYTTSLSRNLHLFNRKPFLLPCEGEMSWALQRPYVPAYIYFPRIPMLPQGSGKTLAYGLPILHKLLSRRKHPVSKTRRSVRALILAPTRELALQISSHLKVCLNDVHAPDEGLASKDPKTPDPPPFVSVAAVVGGMSSQKQKRILSRGVDVLVATPGRLWDIMQEVCNIRRSVNVF